MGQPRGWAGLAQAYASDRAWLPAHRPVKPMDYQELWDIDELSNYLGVPKQTIYSWRTTGYGPKGMRIGKHLRLAGGDRHRLDPRARGTWVSPGRLITRPCPRCGRTIYEAHPRRPGRPKRWCSQECRGAASEERRAAANGAVAIRLIESPVSIEDQMRAVLESPAACRRVLPELVDRAATGSLDDSRWRSVVDELQRLRQPEGRPRDRYQWRP